MATSTKKSSKAAKSAENNPGTSAGPAANPKPDKLRSLLSKFTHVGQVTWMRTGIHAVDLCIGGGIPLGRIIEIYGTESGGKTLLAYYITKACQQMGGVGIMYDVESAAEQSWMKTVGLDTDMLIYEKTLKTVEQIRDHMVDHVEKIRAVDKHVPIVVVWDSIAATTARQEWDKKDIEKISESEQPARLAAALSKFFKQFTIWLAQNNVTLVCVNQIRDNVGAMFGEKTKTPGGHALKFHSSVRIKLNKGKVVDVSGLAAGVDVYCTIKKNKVSPPERKAVLKINYGQGFDQFAGLASVLESAKRIKLVKGDRYLLGERDFDAKDLPTLAAENPNLLEAWL